ncbi:MAG: methanethiol S-methyltransferase [Planctomycetota bacterium]|jgi:protein-S-isoprenylcysteine O-methyltransferase Ste14
MMRAIVFVYGTISYFIGLGALMYMIGFVGNLSFLPKTIDSGTPGPLAVSVLVNVALILLFGLQHAVMARKGFKKAITKIIPAAAERSTFVLMTGIVLSLIMWQWRPIPTTVWDVQNGIAQYAIYGLFCGGWALLVYASFVINHFELFGLQQIWFNLIKKPIPKISFKMPLLYKVVRHPIMLGVLIGIWSIPHMTIGHLVFALSMTGYIVIGVKMEERDLIANHGERYVTYKEQVPALIPSLRKTAMEEYGA